MQNETNDSLATQGADRRRTTMRSVTFTITGFHGPDKSNKIKNFLLYDDENQTTISEDNVLK